MSIGIQDFMYLSLEEIMPNLYIKINLEKCHFLYLKKILINNNF